MPKIDEYELAARAVALRKGYLLEVDNDPVVVSLWRAIRRQPTPRIAAINPRTDARVEKRSWFAMHAWLVDEAEALSDPH